MSNITETAVPIAWEESGSGDPLLLIQGLGYGRWGWEPIVPLLTERFRVVTFDNRGIGESDVPDGPYTAAQMARDCISVLDAAEIEVAHVVGSSLGGMIAQELAIDHSERVGRLVLMSTTPGGGSAFPMPEVTVDLLAETTNLPPEEALRRLVENALSESAPASVIERIMQHRTAKPQDPRGWQAQAAAGINYDGGGRAVQISAPTLIVHGTDDRVIDVRNAALLAHLISDSTVELVSGGHLFFWEQPETTAGTIDAFLEGSP